jgi:predicted DsbA family dithiol-disulfide isomerase
MLAVLASQAGADAAVVLRELESEAHQPRVREDFMSGVNGTPTSFINRRRSDGAWDEMSLLEALEGAIIVAP